LWKCEPGAGVSDRVTNVAVVPAKEALFFPKGLEKAIEFCLSRGSQKQVEQRLMSQAALRDSGEQN
jgi:hypothetical protein